MRRRFLFCFASLLIATAAHAGNGVNLRWDACLSNAGVSSKSFACDTNTGSEFLYVSSVTDSSFTSTGVEVMVNLATTDGSFPNWWRMKTAGSCRVAALSASPTATGQGAGCLNAFPATGSLAVIASYEQLMSYFPFTIRLVVICVPPTDSTLQIPAHQEVLAARIAISHQKTVGTGACTGCEAPVCLVAGQVKWARANSEPALCYEESVPGSSTAGWQGAAPHSSLVPQGSAPGQYPFRVVECSLPVPARNHTWGSIKSLYR